MYIVKMLHKDAVHKGGQYIKTDRKHYSCLSIHLLYFKQYTIQYLRDFYIIIYASIICKTELIKRFIYKN